METLWHTHTTRDTLCLDCRCWLLVFHLFIQPHRRVLVKMLGSPIDPFDSYLLVCLTLPCHPLFTFISLPHLTELRVCMCVQAVAPFHTLKCSLTLWLLCGAGELWAVINLKCYLTDTHTLRQQQDLSAVVPLCNRRWGGNNWGSIHKEKLAYCIHFDLSFILTFKEKLVRVFKWKFKVNKYPVAAQLCKLLS